MQQQPGSPDYAVAMSAARDFGSPDRVPTIEIPTGADAASGQGAPLSPVVSSRGPRSPPSRGRGHSVSSNLSVAASHDGVRRRKSSRTNTVTTYHEPAADSGVNPAPGAEPGVDTSAEDDKIPAHLTNLKADCEINIIDFSDTDVTGVKTDNEGLAAALSAPRSEDLPCRWISVNGLSWDVIKALGRKYNLHRLAIEDLMLTHTRTKVDWYADHAFIVLTLQKLVLLHQHKGSSSKCTCTDVSDAESEEVDEKFEQYNKRHKPRWWSWLKRNQKGDVLPRYLDQNHDGKMDEFISAHSGTSHDTPIKPIRTLHRYESAQIPEHTAWMERHSALANDDMAVSVEQVSIFLTSDNTVLSFFEHSALDVETPILDRLSSRETMLRRSCDASLLLQAIIDAIVDLAGPVRDAYNKARKELQIDAMTNPNIKTSRALHIFGEEVDMLQNLFKPIVHLVNSLRDHNSEPTNVGWQDSPFSPQRRPDKTSPRVETRPPNARKMSDFRKKALAGAANATSVGISPLAHTYFGDVLDHCITMIAALEQMDASANNISTLIFNTVGAKTNSFMMILAIVTVFFAPLTFISGYFGMNFADGNGLHHPFAFFWVVAVPALVSFMFLVFGVMLWDNIKDFWARRGLKANWNREDIHDSILGGGQTVREIQPILPMGNAPSSASAGKSGVIDALYWELASSKQRHSLTSLGHQSTDRDSKPLQLDATTMGVLQGVAAGNLDSPTSSTTLDSLANKTFDYIIIGGGTSGCLLASRLANSPAKPSILLVEAGGEADEDPENLIPGLVVPKFGNENGNWLYQTTPQKELNDRTILYPRGRGMGGSSANNFSSWVRGPKCDWDSWAESVGDEWWEWESVVERMKNLEDFREAVPEGMETYVQFEEEMHRKGGPVGVGAGAEWQGVVRHCLDAGVQVGHELNRDHNTGRVMGVSVAQMNVDLGERRNAADAFLGRGKRRELGNLDVVTRTICKKVVFEGKKAVGVDLLPSVPVRSKTDDPITVHASKEIILSAGTFATPQILLLSGIGPAAELSQHNIPVVHDLPHVGKNLRDHTAFAIEAVIDPSIRGHNQLLHDSEALTAARKQYDATRTGPLAVFGASAAVLFTRTPDLYSSPEFKALPPDLQAFLDTPERPSTELWLHGGPVFYTQKTNPEDSILAVEGLCQNLLSRGSVTLRSSDPRDLPVVDPAYCTEPFDWRVAIETVKVQLKLLQASAMRSILRKVLYGPGEVNADASITLCSTDDEVSIRRWLQQELSQGFHAMGTCVMGSESHPQRVVNPELQVVGLEGLRIADMSVCPILTNNHTQINAYLIAEKCAQAILGGRNKTRDQ